ncbi:MAG: hypothetical protein DI570_10040 [Phenylobacterium zucineum]|nr:MAG: hypothetical protein DI570_10040 [Phenylobacterium zucineum]
MIDAELLLLRGISAEEAGDYDTARLCFRQAADFGDAVGLNCLAYMFDVGLGAPPDKAEAMRLYRRAWRLGSFAAANNIAVLYREAGRRRQAHQWFVRAAEAGDGDACLEVAKGLIAGDGVRRSAEIGMRWLQAVATSGCSSEDAEEEAAALLQILGPKLA